jgi:transposase InsO family protein
LSRRHGVAEGSIYRWQVKIGGMGVLDVKRLRELEIEDARSTLGDWQRHYNHFRPHRSLGKKPPAVFAQEAA